MHTGPLHTLPFMAQIDGNWFVIPSFVTVNRLGRFKDIHLGEACFFADSLDYYQVVGIGFVHYADKVHAGTCLIDLLYAAEQERNPLSVNGIRNFRRLPSSSRALRLCFLGVLPREC